MGRRVVIVSLLQPGIVWLKTTTKCWTWLSTSCCTLFGDHQFCTCVIVAQNIWMSRTEYIPPTWPSRLTIVYNPSKLTPSSSLEAPFFLYIFWIFLCLIPKSCNLYGTNELSVSKWIIKLNKRTNFFFILISILPSYNVILLKPPCNNVVSSIPFKFFLAVKICKRKISLIS